MPLRQPDTSRFDAAAISIVCAATDDIWRLRDTPRCRCAMICLCCRRHARFRHASPRCLLPLSHASPLMPLIHSSATVAAPCLRRRRCHACSAYAAQLPLRRRRCCHAARRRRFFSTACRHALPLPLPCHAPLPPRHATRAARVAADEFCQLMSLPPSYFIYAATLDAASLAYAKIRAARAMPERLPYMLRAALSPRAGAFTRYDYRLRHVYCHACAFFAFTLPPPIATLYAALMF